MRKATINDIDFYISIYKDSNFSYAWEETSRKFDEKYMREKIRNAIEEGKDIVEIIVENEENIGFLWGRTMKDHFGNEYGTIEILLIKEEYQNKGIGTKIEEYFTEKMRNIGINDIRISVLEYNLKGKKFWERHNYKPFLQTLRKLV